MTPLISGIASVASLLFNAASGKSAATPRAKSQEAAPDPSAVVTLSKEAETLAGFASKGILTAAGKVDGALGSSDTAGKIGEALSKRAVSKEDFQALLTRFGATDAQKEQITTGFDADSDGSISQDEFLKGIASTSGAKGGSDFSQALLQLVDRHGNANGVVNQAELAQFTTAFANAQQRKLA
jgi:hypothetical protein